MISWPCLKGDLEVMEQVRAGHGPPGEEVLGHPVILALHLSMQMHGVNSS